MPALKNKAYKKGKGCMKRKFRKKMSVFILMIVLSVSFTLVSSAKTVEYVPFESYTYWENVQGKTRKAVKNRPMFETKTVINANSINISDFDEMLDVCTDTDGYIYLLDKNSRIVILDDNYSLLKVITSVKGEKVYTFEGAMSIYVHGDKTIYISDTENHRVLSCDNMGNLLDIYYVPDSPLIPEEFNFRPIKTAVNSEGYIYILSEGSYNGAMLYAPDKTFIGFYGANSVTNNISDIITSLINRMFPNSEKAGNSKRRLPSCFSDIVIDNKDFVYTSTDNHNEGQIKKLEPGAGLNILKSDDVQFADEEINRLYRPGYELFQGIIGLAVDKDGFMYGLDTTYGRIFVYDQSCRMITAFGGGMGSGSQKGTFSNACSIDINGSDVLVCDKGDNSLTVFSRNVFGNEVFSLVTSTLKGDYSESKSGWEKVIGEDRNLQVAYNGLARAYLYEENYIEAMKIARDGYDRDTYALSYEYYRKNFLSDNFALMFGIIVFLATLAVVTAFAFKRKKIFSKNQNLKIFLQIISHPINSFDSIKDKSNTSLTLAFITVLLFYVTAVLKVVCGGFIFTNYDPATFNSIWTFVQSAGLVILLVVSNWLITSLLDGKGTFKEIAVVTSYSLLPIILSRIVWIILSNFLLPTEESFMSILSTVAFIWSILLLTIGMMRIHEYTLRQFVATSALTVIGMAAIVFLLILIGILVQQLGGFLLTLLIELRM